VPSEPEVAETPSEEPQAQAPASSEPEQEEAPAPPAAEAVSQTEPAGAVESEDLIDLNSAGYEELRGLRLSVTQTGRVLAFRERTGGFKSVDELESIPGFPRDFLLELKRKVRV
jgi:DNA uptake protein ComE-like DNA-binding protein